MNQQQADPLALPSPMKMLGELHGDVRRNLEALKWLKTMATIITETVALVLATLVEVFVRTNFGERYFSIRRVVSAFVVLQFAGVVILATSGRDAANSMVRFSMVFVLVSAIQIVQIAVRNRRGIRWHSRCSGESFLMAIPWPSFLNMNAWRIAFIYEPLLVVVAGYLLSDLDAYVGATVMLGGMSMLAVSLVQYEQYRNALLDRIDAQIESEAMAEALEGKPMKETKGFVVPGAKQLAKTAVGFQQAAAGLDPDLRDIIEPKAPGARPGLEPQASAVVGRDHRARRADDHGTAT